MDRLTGHISRAGELRWCYKEEIVVSGDGTIPVSDQSEK
jgi:hypothetical protein